MVSPVDYRSGRTAQKLRTRKALIQAAWELLKGGQQPTLEEVADRALVSRATAYRYFPNRERLFIEAILNREPLSPEELLGARAPSNVSGRVTLVLDHTFGQIGKSETLYRSLLRATQEEWIEHRERRVLRGDQRRELIEAALEPVAGKLEEAELEKLTLALTAMISTETFVALRDVCQLSKQRSREIMSWAVQTLTTAAIRGD